MLTNSLTGTPPPKMTMVLFPRAVALWPARGEGPLPAATMHAIAVALHSTQNPSGVCDSASWLTWNIHRSLKTSPVSAMPPKSTAYGWLLLSSVQECARLAEGSRAFPKRCVLQYNVDEPGDTAWSVWLIFHVPLRNTPSLLIPPNT